MNRVIVGVVVVTSFSVLAKSPVPTFEVASIKLVVPPMSPHVVGLNINHGTAKLEGATVRQIIV
jgi:hypothetical protein